MGRVCRRYRRTVKQRVFRGWSTAEMLYSVPFFPKECNIVVEAGFRTTTLLLACMAECMHAPLGQPIVAADAM